MSLHLISEDLRDHAWYEELFVRTITEVEEYAARWAAFEELVAPVGEDPAELGA
ncbi:MAG: hypothetical protein ABSB24_19365 [Gaiellaceae bacterium]|jgi:hypothetical protein